ncbi:hypothetical protein NQ028_06770 [Corynebacterium phoceense]|uniref:hypothetical protein n=1 Tax=Corynebacterium phoceense TaxID=1686286 RepID=UPI00211BAD0E|nr:hypothetical protein [Corynebacterium phoceense]MCQ9340846.1 hypothetical protein [Corynebacterium phoceense]
MKDVGLTWLVVWVLVAIVAVSTFFYAIEEYACDKGEVRYSGDLISGCFPADSPVVLNGR